MKIGIVNYSIGNVGSVLSAFKFYNYDVSLIDDPDDLNKVNIIILAGVGNFATATIKLKEARFWDKLNYLVLIKKKPVMGICLGMQIFADIGYEDGINKGFGWIKGKVIKIEEKGLIVPHIGWNRIHTNNNELFKNMRYHSFYFMHSYHFVPDDKKRVIAAVNYGSLKIAAAVKQDNIIGSQFHPEKSQADGLRFLKNSIEVLSKL